jgi:hypothetical protein
LDREGDHADVNASDVRVAEKRPGLPAGDSPIALVHGKDHDRTRWALRYADRRHHLRITRGTAQVRTQMED